MNGGSQGRANLLEKQILRACGAQDDKLRDLARRVNEHKRGFNAGFTSRYRITRLVDFEEFPDIRDAIAREKAIKGWKRSRKISLVEARNHTWEGLAESPPHPSFNKSQSRMSS